MNEPKEPNVNATYMYNIQFRQYLIPQLYIQIRITLTLKVLGKIVGLCKTTKRKDQLYISLLVSVWRIICEHFNPNGLILAEI